ncbi:hypothetical protein EGI94_01215 [Stutzerimonas stutzeri]|nr:hypothetical protein EGI94_01215 [Stutzerimonas stutzeri]
MPISELLEGLVSPCWASFFGSRPKRNQKVLPLHPGLAALDFPRSLVPSFHRCSGGRRTRAIHGPLRLSRHPCRSLPSATIPLGLLKGANGIA